MYLRRAVDSTTTTLRLTLAEAAFASCPSARPDAPGAMVFAVIGSGDPADGDAGGPPRVAYLQRPARPTAGLLDLAAPADPTTILRFAGRCAESRCRHFAAARCALGERLIDLLPAVSDTLPQCALRPTCRWWREQGAAACHRCPQVISPSFAPVDLAPSAPAVEQSQAI
jgi:hypothetical protein